MKLKALSPLILAASIVAFVAGGTALPAAADPPVVQQAVLVKDDPKNPRSFTYYEHISGIGQGDLVCYGTSGPCKKRPPNSGKVTYSVKLYRLKEREKRYDYYFVDVTSTTSKRHGDGDKGAMSVTIDPTSKVNTTANVYSKSTIKDDCHSYPVNLGVSMGPVGVGTTVATLSTCDKAQLHTTKLPSNTVRYHVYSLNRFRSWSVQKWVRVAAGAKPTFAVTVRWRNDNCTVLRKTVKAYANVKTATKVIKISAR